ncbi:AraC family transcriptional regulator [Mastigocoleus sp. MO_188.B34]|uniref:helix-turn-helix domain-containing protein n=1 Tax=Mastigocoleus sp. MO_188.B34 TaxID=3036635 RepID=UPI002637C66C|nr:AraC family transcriptional regulator [Mastigocoleus sp. MO_188.B34]MDJ0694515.1 AraC family transcriptional regulator [Mastigocoleus sp. MO_188.B34]
MIKIVFSNEHTKTKNLVVKCLKKAGFEVINAKNDSIRIQLANNKIFSTAASKESNSSESIFPSNSRLKEVFEFIELNYDQPISLKKVAQAVGYSSAYLTDLVKRLTGKTVNNWIIERRIVEAKRLLLETNYSVKQIALDVGYQNINHFYEQFHDYYKKTPNAWRKAQQCKVV